jgi:hypothetical protein
MAARLIGYSHAMDFLGRGDWSLEAFQEFLYKFQASSRQLAKSQIGWLRNDRIFHDVVPLAAGPRATAEAVLDRFLSSPAETAARRDAYAWPELTRNEKKAMRLHAPPFDTTVAGLHGWLVALRNAGCEPCTWQGQELTVEMTERAMRLPR